MSFPRLSPFRIATRVSLSGGSIIRLASRFPRLGFTLDNPLRMAPADSIRLRQQ